VRQIHHKDAALDDPLVAHDIPENDLLSIHINTAYILKDHGIIAFFIYCCKTHSCQLLMQVLNYFSSSFTNVRASPRRILPFWKSDTASLMVVAAADRPIFPSISAL